MEQKVLIQMQNVKFVGSFLSFMKLNFNEETQLSSNSICQPRISLTIILNVSVELNLGWHVDWDYKISFFNVFQGDF